VLPHALGHALRDHNHVSLHARQPRLQSVAGPAFVLAHGVGLVLGVSERPLVGEDLVDVRDRVEVARVERVQVLHDLCVYVCVCVLSVCVLSVLSVCLVCA
jgi:hypothetical protein